MSAQNMHELRKKTDQAWFRYLELKEQYEEAVTASLEAVAEEYGGQKRLADETGLSRETLRQLPRRYYRSVTRYGANGEALIKMPADNVTNDRLYEIRDTDKSSVIADRVPGRELLKARHDQLANYRQADPTRENIAVVDVADLISEFAVDPETYEA